MGDMKKPYSQVDDTAFVNQSVPTTYTMTDVDSMAEYAAKQYAKTPQEYLHYIQYYQALFVQQIYDENSVTLHQKCHMEAANAAALVQSRIQLMCTNKLYGSTHLVVPTGTDGKKYPIPDISKYVYDKTTGYQYDHTTGLYYDPNSNYYWNNILQKYLYWDYEKSTYTLAPTYIEHMNNQPQVANVSHTTQKPQKQKTDKKDKVKVAKKIAKDMERWAKALNQNQQTCNIKAMADNTAALNSASADIGFSVLKKKSAALPSPPFGKQNLVKEFPTASTVPLLAAYTGESEWSAKESNLEDLLDYTKLICNLCKRQLGSAKILTQHAKLSALHKRNLEALKNEKRSKSEKQKIMYHDTTNDSRLKYGDPNEPCLNKLEDKYLKEGELEMSIATPSEKIDYCDAAKERRTKYGDPYEPHHSKLDEKYLKQEKLWMSIGTSSVSEPIELENAGNGVLQKMGQTADKDLGQQSEKRTMIQAEQHSNTVDPEKKLTGYMALPTESYKDCVKKIMYARYQETK